MSDATEIYFCPASFAAITAARSSIVLRALSRRISIGRLEPAITSVRPASRRLIARFDGVPQHRSVSKIGSASCRERVCQYVSHSGGGEPSQKNKNNARQTGT